ncbi:HTTM domain-containing protein [Halobacterium zhouii]|uniref:HTTM domain-containing protein n=1 Tax=Halobacterium zhouii TaxID=2902624 RepID=UPI001E55B7E3|nr:HTTM domain-containing protein [Halobacterium zhouii]
MSARALGSQIQTAVARRVSVDARALAAFRVGVGALLLADLLLRARHLKAFYTDQGVLPRAVLAEQYPTFAAFSLHALSGAAWFQVVLFAVAGVAALALLIGYRTTLATVVSLVLLVSLHARNPVVLNGGDSLFRQLLFWSVFLPLGTRWSVDARHRQAANEQSTPSGASAATQADRTSSKEGEVAGQSGGPADHWTALAPRVTSVASAALLVQVVLVYVVNAVLKLRGDAWLSGDAVRVVFALDQFTVFLGDALAQYPAVLEVASHVWLVLLVCSPLLLVVTGWRRAVLAGLFASVHLGMLLTMQLGLFPLISMVALVPFLPPVVWDWVSVPSVALLDDLADALPAFADHSLPEQLYQWAGTVVPAALACLLVVALAWNAASLGFVTIPDSVNPEPGNERPDYRWNMFAPEPLSVDGWVRAPGRLASGAQVDAFHGGAVRWTKPPDVAATYPTARWRKYIANVWRGNGDTLERGFADYLCARWDASHESDLVNVSVYYVEEPVRLGAPDPTERVELYSQPCPS